MLYNNEQNSLVVELCTLLFDIQLVTMIGCYSAGQRAVPWTCLIAVMEAKKYRSFEEQKHGRTGARKHGSIEAWKPSKEVLSVRRNDDGSSTHFK